jgi:glyoxylase-like metal-dependent hydrolase (beta-lactamase superfamily II)
MKLAEHVFQVTGHITGLNANSFVIETNAGLVLIDTGYRDYYCDSMKQMLKFWKVKNSTILAVFLTHGHFDHSGNSHIYSEQGIPVYIGEHDAVGVKNGGRLVMEPEFGTKFTTPTEIISVKEGDLFDYGNAVLRVIDLPGHTCGSVGYLVHIDELDILFIGDMFLISGAEPDDTTLVEMGYDGGIDYDPLSNLASFKKLMAYKVDIIVPGHRGPFYGDCAKIFQAAYNVARERIQGQVSEI